MALELSNEAVRLAAAPPHDRKEQCNEMKKKEKLIAPLFVYSYNHETDGHFCGKKQGEEPPCEELYFLYDELKAIGVGGEYVENGFSSPPAVGERRYEITRITEDGVYGICTKDTVRIMKPSELE